MSDCSLSLSGESDDSPIDFQDKRKGLEQVQDTSESEVKYSKQQKLIGDVDYIGKGGIILNIYDTDNSPEDIYDDDFYNEANEDFTKTTAEPTVALPNIREPSQQEYPKRKTINRHIAHDQEVEHFKHNYTIGLEDDPIFNCKEIVSQYCIPRIFCL